MAVAFALSACGAEDQAPQRGQAGSGSGIENPVSIATSCTRLNETAACSCGSLPGRAVCDGSRFGACECAPADASGAPLSGNARSDIHFQWDRTPAGMDLGGCLPGDYEGTFGGIYWSYIATIAPIDDLAVPVANIDLPDQPSGFHFTVEPAQGGETVLEIKGVMDGTADLTFPFNADIEGELDCRTKTFTARMYNGVYSVLIEGLAAQAFIGVMNGHYDVRTHTFIDGEWDVWETSGQPPGTQAPMLPRDFDRDGFGGYGSGAAALPTDRSDPALQPCPSSDFSCDVGPLGPNKYLCNSLLGPPGCTSDADCAAQFPAGTSVDCLKTSAFSTCLLECKP